MNISMDSFKIIGGLFLIVIAFQMVFEQRQERRQSTADNAIDDETIKSIAIFPLAIPLIAGPGAMATSLLLSKEEYASFRHRFTHINSSIYRNIGNVAFIKVSF